jgi:hypothetical protein
VLTEAKKEDHERSNCLICNEKGLLNRFQSGFRPGHSKTTALLKINRKLRDRTELGSTFFTPWSGTGPNHKKMKYIEI